MKPIEILEQFGNVRRSLGRASSICLQQMDIGPKQLVVLRVVGQRQKCSMSDIAEATASDMASVTRMVASLVDSGWVEKRRADNDRRQWEVSLSTKGQSEWPNINLLVQNIATAFVSALSDNEQETLFQLLNKVQRGLQQSLQANSPCDVTTASKTQE